MSAASPFVGEICMFAGNYAPRGWAFCNGQLLPIAQYEALFVLLGTTYGGDGQNTFALPDLRSRVPLHAGLGPGLSNRTLGEASGTESVTLLSTQLPAHNHTVTLNVSTGPANTANPAAAVMAVADESRYASAVAPDAFQAATSLTLGPSGGNQPHMNLQPSQTINFIIALEGMFPSRN
jgi:microcystin-dependent protein